LAFAPGNGDIRCVACCRSWTIRHAAVTILLGDFNEWLLWGRPLRWVNRRFGSLPAPPTFPSRRPLMALDRIWVDPADRLISLHHHRHPSAAIASDHLPLVAQVAV
jgi:endonuclease/exonuclease/phosphatase family metal-dependent hydrolase